VDLHGPTIGEGAKRRGLHADQPGVTREDTPGRDAGEAGESKGAGLAAIELARRERGGGHAGQRSEASRQRLPRSRAAKGRNRATLLGDSP